MQATGGHTAHIFPVDSRAEVHDMVVPAAMFIEEAVDVLKQKDQKHTQAELHELAVACPTPASLIGGTASDFEAGYQLGLTVMRVLLLQNPKAVQAGIDYL
jgi:hypothetical protein